MDTDKIIEQLENSLIAELNTPEPDNNGVTWLNEKLVDVYENLKIIIESDEHPPAHFHIKINGKKASFDIESCNKLDGSLSPNEEKKIKKWYNTTGAKELLIKIWNETRPSDCSVGKYRGQA